ncbi:Uncharacterized protein OBRU01_10434 [Operophtera brumata]|uniref:Uncharacterized protein n=1 Tax=Operophtera brumata TaxID=104452 RepID=A0A0L7LEK6_OPEBR|nr:Uncharacterized protein OBRU01_10434 [Operophtera brumata]
MEAARDKLIAGVAAWVANPLPQVGAKSTGLLAAPRGQDIYSATGCRGGSLTSWAQGSVSSLASLQLYAGDGPARVNLPADDLLRDQPTAEELNAAQPNQRLLFKSGKLRYFRGLGFLSRKQMINDRYQRRIGANLARNQEVVAAAAARDAQLQGAEARLVAGANVRVDPAVEGGPGGGVPVVGEDGAVGELHPEPEDAPDAVRPAQPAAVPDAARPAQAVAAGVDNVNWNTFSDTVPVYSVGVNTWADEKEVVPYSSLYNHIAERITDPNATGALGALVKGTTMKDSASVITMVKHMQRGNGSYRDEAPLVRAYNMLTTTAAHGSPPDPVVYKWMRNFIPAGDVQLETFQGQPVGGSVIAVPHDMFAEYAFLNFNTPFPGIGGGVHHFSMDSMDETWVAIPVSNDLARTKALIPYMLSFLTSGYTNGTANHIIPGQFNSPQHEGQRMQMGSYRLFPRSNLAYIPGAIHAILVLTDCIV